MDDGQKQQWTDNKIIGCITEPDITTVDGQKIIGGITTADLKTVDGQEKYRGRKKPNGGAKNSGKKKGKKCRHK